MCLLYLQPVLGSTGSGHLLDIVVNQPARIPAAIAAATANVPVDAASSEDDIPSAYDPFSQRTREILARVHQLLGSSTEKPQTRPFDIVVPAEEPRLVLKKPVSSALTCVLYTIYQHELSDYYSLFTALPLRCYQLPISTMTSW